MGHASTSGLYDALDLSIADTADSQSLDDQAAKDILESGSYLLLDPSTGDNPDDKDKVDPSRTDVPNHDTPTNETDSASKDAGNGDTTSKIRRRVMMQEITEGTTVLHHYQPKAARVSSARRLLN